MSSQQTFSAVCLIALAAVFAVVGILPPGVLPPCPLHALTGLFCPGCGITRMLLALVHGQPVTAFRQNPMVFVMLPVAVAALIHMALPVRLQSPAVQRVLQSPAWPLGLVAAVAVFTILRNIPVWPACTLAPGGC